MSFCCFPKLSCFKPKSRISSATESAVSGSKRIEKSFSFDNPRSALNSSKLVFLGEDKSMTDFCKNMNLSRSSSHKSMIAVRRPDRFEILKPASMIKPNQKITSLNVSKISNVSFSDNSIVSTVKEIVFPEKSQLKDSLSGASLKKKKNLNVMLFINAKKKEAPPMFLHNPCFFSGGSTLVRSDNEN